MYKKKKKKIEKIKFHFKTGLMKNPEKAGRMTSLLSFHERNGKDHSLKHSHKRMWVFLTFSMAEVILPMPLSFSCMSSCTMVWRARRSSLWVDSLEQWA